MLAQHANDLILGKSASPHHSSPSDELTYQWHDFRGARQKQAEVRYRMSYTVDDHGVLRSASGVWSNAVSLALLPLAHKYRSEFFGEAIPLRFPGRGVLLLLPIADVGQDTAIGMIRNLFSHRAGASGDDRVSNTAEVAKMVGQSRAVRCARYGTPQPRLEPREVSFDTCLNFVFLKDPRAQGTLKRADVVAGSFKDLPGVQLAAVNVTITHEPVTRGIETLLPWLLSAQESWKSRVVSNETEENFLVREILNLRR
jgi:hypothetical protein